MENVAWPDNQLFDQKQKAPIRMRYCMKKIMKEVLKSYSVNVSVLTAVLAKFPGKNRSTVFAGG